MENEVYEDLTRKAKKKGWKTMRMKEWEERKAKKQRETLLAEEMVCDGRRGRRGGVLRKLGRAEG